MWGGNREEIRRRPTRTADARHRWPILQPDRHLRLWGRMAASRYRLHVLADRTASSGTEWGESSPTSAARSTDGDSPSPRAGSAPLAARVRRRATRIGTRPSHYDMGVVGGRAQTSFAAARRAGVGVTLSSAAGGGMAGATTSTFTSSTPCGVTRPSVARSTRVQASGAFEHLCSRRDYRAGKQNEIYAGAVRRFLLGAKALLPENGRFYLQTMVFVRKWIPLRSRFVDALMGAPPSRLRRPGISRSWGRQVSGLIVAAVRPRPDRRCARTPRFA